MIPTREDLLMSTKGNVLLQWYGINRVIVDCGFMLVAAITRQSREELALVPGSPVTAAIKATAIHVVPRT